MAKVIFQLFSIAIFSVALLLNACTTYDLDESDNGTLSGLLTKAIHKKENRGRTVTTDEFDEEPIYVDYSKNNPVLLHDDEYERDQEYGDVDPFAEEDQFAEYQDLKKSKQAERDMKEDHKVKKDGDPVSIW